MPPESWWIEFVGGPRDGERQEWPYPIMDVICRDSAGHEYVPEWNADGFAVWHRPHPGERGMPVGARVVRLLYAGKRLAV